MIDKLLSFYTPTGPERVGFVLRSGEVVEVKNTAKDTDNAFAVSAEDLIAYEDEMVATFHTHPSCTSNLSGEDYVAFRNWPSVKHFIIGSDGVACYSVTSSGVVLRDEAEDCSAW